MADSKHMFVRHVHTGEIKKVTPDQRESQDKNYWVRVTGKDVQETAPATAPAASDVEATPKTASRASTPEK